MNIVDLLKDQLSGPMGKQLGNAMGVSESDTGKLLGAAVPSILGGLGKLASTNAGADKIAKSINGMDSASFGDLGSILGNLTGGAQPSAAGSGGLGGMLGGLLGGNVIDGLAAQISKLTGISVGLVKTGLTYLTPIVLGAIGKGLKGAPVTGSSINNFFVNQKDNIKSALPAGLSLDSIPGIQGLASAPSASSVPNRVAPEVESSSGSMAKVLVPLLIVAAIAAGAYLWTRPKAEDAVPNTNDVTRDRVTEPNVQMGSLVPSGLDGIKTTLTAAFDKMTSSLDSVKDATTAEAAVPSIKESISSLEKISAAAKMLPGDSKASLTEFVKGQLEKLNPIIERITAIPGIGDTVKQLLEQLKTKLEGLV